MKEVIKQEAFNSVEVFELSGNIGITQAYGDSKITTCIEKSILPALISALSKFLPQEEQEKELKTRLQEIANDHFIDRLFTVLSDYIIIKK